MFLALALAFPFGHLLLGLLPSCPWKLMQEQNLAEAIPSPFLSPVARDPLSPLFPAQSSSPGLPGPSHPMTAPLLVGLSRR